MQPVRIGLWLGNVVNGRAEQSVGDVAEENNERDTVADAVYLRRAIRWATGWWCEGVARFPEEKRASVREGNQRFI